MLTVAVAVVAVVDVVVVVCGDDGGGGERRLLLTLRNLPPGSCDFDLVRALRRRGSLKR